jgi:hypothetical protein
MLLMQPMAFANPIIETKPQIQSANITDTPSEQP